ncbi:hypothetical protein [Candidatus Thiosymbion oneisti]|uniref:hypothetical protein n=1 Tax=Candidatus Thiosymbion oneisti TaxID=589554 RepID=UPI000B8018AA|nr:hypothetical protein [Candidatus Thiosymbion oneisti]
MVYLNVSHAKTDKCFVNSGYADLGTLYLYDTKNEKLLELADIKFTGTKTGHTYEKQEARDIEGMKINIMGNLDKLIVADAKAKIENGVYIELTNAFKEKYRGTFSDLARTIREKIASGEDVRNSWFLEEASKNNSRYRHVIVYSTIKADKAKIEYANSVVIGGKIKLPAKGGGSIEAKLEESPFEKFKGKAVPVFVDYHIIRTTKGRNKNNEITYQFRVDTDFRDKTKRLLAALKKK